MHFAPRFNRPFSLDDLEGIQNDALRVLDQIGIACSHQPTVDCLTSWNGVRYEEGRLHFAQNLSRPHVKDVERRSAAVPPPPEPPFELAAPWCCMEYADPRTGTVRPPTTADAVEMARMMDTRGGRNWPIPLIPSTRPGWRGRSVL